MAIMLKITYQLHALENCVTEYLRELMLFLEVKSPHTKYCTVANARHDN